MVRKAQKAEEALAHWGILTGKVLHSKVLDFKKVTSTAAHRRRIQQSTKAKRGQVLTSVRDRARLVIEQTWALAKRVAKESHDCYDKEWETHELLPQLFSTEYNDSLILLARAATKMLTVQPVVAEASAPCRIYGDLHGQFRDLLLFFWAFGSPLRKDAPMLIFNGDFVDRGAHQLETVGILLALKVLLPERVWLIRGNHEDRSMNMRYGFHSECVKKLGASLGGKVFDSVHKAFDQLPLACVVNKRILVVHGGLGDGSWQLDHLTAITRPIQDIENQPWLNNILWSDPIEDDAQRDAGVFGVHPSPRGGNASQFGWNITKTFCARNGLSLIVRSHQSKQDSLGFDVMHDNQLIRVFSARDYEGHGNDGAVLFVQKQVREKESSANANAKVSPKAKAKAKAKAFILTVRPQVLRSVTKARVDEEQKAESRMVRSSSDSDTASNGSNGSHRVRKSLHHQARGSSK